MIRSGVAEVVNGDPAAGGRLKVVFFPDFNVKNAHAIYPAADLSEQISTAGKEASGTGNMKFMLNGAVTIGTLDGANVEIREEVGAENFFLFGLTAGEVERVKREGYRPATHSEGNAELREALDLVAGGHFSRGDRETLEDLHVILNMSDGTVKAALPPMPGRRWHVALDTSRSSPQDILAPRQQRPHAEMLYPAGAHSVIVLEARA